jgi:UTP-glucose-1-phosphate uridylyltransferase
MYAVVSGDTPDTTFEHLRMSLGSPKGKNRVPVAITRIVQEQPVGLGNAILMVREHLDGAPVAVLLPDEIDPSREALGQMVALYDAERRPILALNPPSRRSQDREIKYYGIAVLDEKQSSSGRLRQIRKVAEKPVRDGWLGVEVRTIAGRYVLTSEVMDELQRLKPNERTGKYELTDALSSVLQSQAVLALELETALLPLEPVRSLIELLVMSIDDRTKFEHVLRLTAKLVNNIEKL